MVSQLVGALLRALCVASVVLLPSLLLPDVPPDNAHVMLVVALLAGLLAFMEYCGRYPSIVEFRFAPPYNRLRFAAVAAAIVILSLILRGKAEPGVLSGALTQFGEMLGRALDFPYSPVRLVLLMLPADAEPAQVLELRIAAGICYSLALVTVAVFLLLVRLQNWPMQRGAFNVWINLPLFDPTRGGDLVGRLRRDAGINIALGVLLPFLIPVAVKLMTDGANTLLMANPQTMIWAITAWAFLPASMVIRGVALMRVAGMIAARRRRVCADAASASALQEA